MDEIARLLSLQSGVVSRRQVERWGGRRSDIERALRRRDWVRLLPGVYVDHTGEPTWLQRAWAGVLVAERAALSGRSALRAVAGSGWRDHDEDLPIEIAVDRDRHLPRHVGYRFRRMADVDTRVHWNTGPPRVRVEHAVLDGAVAASDELSRISLLADACQSRLTTATRILDVAAGRPRLSHRDFLVRVLHDIADGSCSVLEHGYLTRIERAHGLPRGRRQVPARSQTTSCLRDVEYVELGRIVELDGALVHGTRRQRDSDLDRDLAAAVAGRLTVRLGWGQVFGRPCPTTTLLGEWLRAGGWEGRPQPCGPGCPV